MKEPTNADRAQRAREILENYPDEGNDLHTKITDLLADIMHLVDQEDEVGDWQRIINMAEHHHEEEVSEELRLGMISEGRFDSKKNLIPVNPNARFWTWINNGWVKVTLKPGQVLSWSKFYNTEEGWHCDSERWSYPHDCFSDEREIRREWISDGVDCDGRLCNYGEQYCLIDRLQRFTVTFTEPYAKRAIAIETPDWIEITSRVYDQNAQAAGY